MSLLEDQKAAAISAAAMLQHLSLGPLAELRRMTEDTGAPVFWRFVARNQNRMGGSHLTPYWMEFLRILAILTPKGDPANRTSLHDPKRPLGQVLCDGGDPSWNSPPPAFSDRRLTQLMAARGRQRAVLLTRAARMLAGGMVPGSGVNVVDIALTLLYPTKGNGRLLAEPYYRRLDRVEFSTNKMEEGANK